ncbi:MAG: Rid family hydrolase [Isosphaeraceae bacterium]
MREATLILTLGAALSSPAVSDEPRRITIQSGQGFPDAVVVPESLSLVHTTQILALDGSGAIVHEATERQAAAILERLDQTLAAYHTDTARLVKVNLYAIDHEALGALRAALLNRLDGRPTPAISAVVTRLPLPQARVALDAVATRAVEARSEDSLEIGPNRPLTARTGSVAAVLPRGRRVYVSGQADPAPSLSEATRKTLESLDATLKHLGLNRRQVVQAKSFLTPMSSVEEAAQQFVSFFGKDAIPPLVFVEWRMNTPIEIELVVAAGASPDGPPIEYLSTPELKPSPVFSRIARINRGDLIYTSDVAGSEGTSASDQVEAIFAKLKSVMAETGSDLRHLAKATYYVADDEASRALNDLRPRHYDPARPPAASKATVAEVGIKGRTVTLDMIAIKPPR